MAKLVAVYRSDEYQFERRQLPLTVDDKLQMVVQFTDTCVGCGQVGIKQRELENFVEKFHALTSDEVAVALMVTNKDIFSLLSQLVPCVGCRRSVERLFNQLIDSGHPALEPLVITSASVMSIMHDVLFDPKAIYALFYIHGSKLTSVMESIPKSKKNKRCLLHSLDSHKQKSLGSWIDVWDLMSHECREEVVLMKCDNIMDTLLNYLRKHRFCAECKSKVLRAYSILVEELDAESEKGYCRNLYEGIRCCKDQRHIHIKCDTAYIARLISRAEPELTGSRRERHAKTLDIAQEEVLTCLAIHLYERLHRIWQKLKAEEQTWQILFYLGVDALRKNFGVALEKKQGISNLELMCQELMEEEQAKEQKRELKRQKRKKKKNKNKIDDNMEDEADMEKENNQCDENTNDTSTICASCDDHKVSVQDAAKRGPAPHHHHHDPLQYRCSSPPSCLQPKSNDNQTLPCSDPCRCDSQLQSSKYSGFGCRSDCGYSSGAEGCESCSMPSSNDGSDIACSEGMCNPEEDCQCPQNDLPQVCEDCLIATCHPQSPKRSSRHRHEHHRTNGGCPRRSRSPESANGTDGNGGHNPKYGTTLSLQDMLEASSFSGEEDEDFISEEEIRNFKANQKILNSQRQELRETLRQRFACMQQRCMCRAETRGSAVASPSSGYGGDDDGGGGGGNPGNMSTRKNGHAGPKTSGKSTAVTMN